MEAPSQPEVHSQPIQKKKSGFRPKSVAIVVAPEEPSMEAKETQVTAVSPQSFSGSEQQAKPRERTKMFGAKPVIFAKQPAVAPLAKPEVFAKQPAAAPLVVPEKSEVTKPQPVFVEPQLVPEQELPSILEELKEESKESKEAEPLTVLTQPQPVAPSIRSTIRLVRPGQQQQEKLGSLLPPIQDTLLYKLMTLIKEKEGENVYTAKDPPPFVAQDRLGFTRFIKAHYPSFALPRLVQIRINPNACNEMKLQTTKYQAFIREYMRQASPYRGVLVYHGLGSGKTCTSIAASEALYGNGHKKIIIMTPISLKENFLNEIMFCGFRHFRLKNVWTSIPLTDATTELFAKETVQIPESLLRTIKRNPDPTKRVIWMPDLEKPENESNFETLEDWKRGAIRDQLYAILQNKFTFIGYTGFSWKKLLDLAKKQPTFFDDAVIVIDEVHNLTRLMTGKLERNFIEAKRVNYKKFYEPITVDPWVPKQDKYSRAYLFYRLLTQAKNSKLIALSGTPVVNQPTEIGILGNILRGYFHCVTADLMETDPTLLNKARSILEQHPRVNFHSIENSGQGTSKVFFTILDQGYRKQFRADGVIEGIVHSTDGAEPSTIQSLYNDISTSFQGDGLSLKSPVYQALPLFPPTVDAFTEAFVDKQNNKLKVPVTFIKRFSGLISYYRGSKEELMPAVKEHPPVECEFSPLGLSAYSVARKKELDESVSSSSQTGYDEVMGLLEQGTSSYRFRSRATCNFAFPSDIVRPFPEGKALESTVNDEVGDIDALLGDAPTDVTESGTSVEEAERAAEVERSIQQEEEDEQPKLPVTGDVKAVKEKYQRDLAAALAELDKRKNVIFKLNPSSPDSTEQLKTYSVKFAKMLETIQASVGSSLIYSFFKTVEGLGIFSMAMDANGFAPIKLTGPDTDLRLDDATVKSFTETPEQPRYILYSGGENIRIRQTLINLFNMRIDKLPPKIAAVLNGLPLKETRNLKGQVCRVFMITAAGAEGLSLRNVRAVHIMEPYWNKVRTDQVKGRAVRICSHSDLPYSEDPAKNERVVEIFNYISVFPKGTVIDQTLITKDESKTTDQHVAKLSEIKNAVSSDFLCHMKSAAVDCTLNKGENEKTIGCFPDEKDVTKFNEPLYDPRLDKDIVKSEQEYKFGADAFCKQSEPVQAPPLQKPLIPQQTVPQQTVPKQTVQTQVQDALTSVSEVVASLIPGIGTQAPLQPLPTLKLKKYPIGGIAYTPSWNPEKSRYDLYDLKTDPEKTKPFAHIKLETAENGSVKEKMIKIK